MAKKTAAKKDKKNTNELEDAILKKYGAVFMNAQSLKEEKPKVIPTTPLLDFALSGGVPEGSFMLITGEPKLGKSSAALHIASQAQKIPWEIKRNGKVVDSGDRKVYYFDIEGRIKERDLFSNTNLDLDPERFILVKSSIDKIIYGEEFLAIGDEIIRNQPGAVLIFDSFSAMCTKERLEADISKRYRDETPGMLSSFCKRICQTIPVNKSIVIGITHRIANQGMGMSMWSEASGQKIQYQADIKLRGMYKKQWIVGQEVVGQNVHWECTTSALGPPGIKSECKLRYKYGYDEAAELVSLCCDFNILNKKGTWISYGDEDDKGEFVRLQGAEKWTEHLKNNPELMKDLRQQVSENLQLKTEHFVEEKDDV